MFPMVFAAMAANNRMTIVQLSHEIGISSRSLSSKLNGHTEFTRGEMVKIQKIVGRGLTLDNLFATEETHD